MKKTCQNCKYNMGCEYYVDCFYFDKKKFKPSDSAQIQEILKQAIKRDDSTRNAVFKGLDGAQAQLVSEWLDRD